MKLCGAVDGPNPAIILHSSQGLGRQRYSTHKHVYGSVMLVVHPLPSCSDECRVSPTLEHRS